MNWPDILVRPKKELAWSYSFEDVLRREVERTIRGVVGVWMFTTRSWTEIGAAVHAQQKEIVKSIQTIVPRTCRDYGIVDDVQIIVLNGQPGPPHPEAPRMHGRLGAPWTYNRGRRGAHALVEPVGLIWIDNFANESLKEELSIFEADMRSCGDVYILELDKVTICRHDVGRPPSWESQAVLLSIRKRPPLVVTLSLLSASCSSNLEISCTSIGGEILAHICMYSRSSCAELKASLAKELGLQEDGLKILSSSGRLLSQKMDALPIKRFLKSAGLQEDETSQ